MQGTRDQQGSQCGGQEDYAGVPEEPRHEGKPNR